VGDSFLLIYSSILATFYLGGGLFAYNDLTASLFCFSLFTFWSSWSLAGYYYLAWYSGWFYFGWYFIFF